MERARKKPIKQAAGLAPSMNTAEPTKAVAKRRRAVAAKKVADPKVVEPIEPSIIEAATPEVSSPTPQAPRRGRPAATAAAKATARTRGTAKPKTAAARPSMGKASAPKAGAKPAAAKTKAPAPKVASPKSMGTMRSKPAPKVVAPKPAASKGVEPLEAGAEIKLGFLADFVGFHLRLAQDASYRAFSRHRDKDLIKPGRLPALAIIHLNPGISQSALGRAIARDKSTVSPLIKDLQKNGFISRKASTQDRRSVTLALTKKGERTLERLQARAQDHEDEIDKIIGTSKGRLLSMLDKITKGMAH